MIYLVDDLIRDFRSDVYDRPDVDDDGNARDTLWSEEDVLRYANSAAAQWAADTLAYRRHMEFDLVAGQSLYKAPYEIIEIVHAEYRYEPGYRGRMLCVFNLDEGVIRDDYGVAYLSTYDLDFATGVPRGVTRDYLPSHLRIYPKPTAIAVPGPTQLLVNAVVYPKTLYMGMPMPSANEQDKRLFLLWMKKLAYAKQDADVQDLDRAKDFENEYFGLMPIRKHEYDRQVRGGGIIHHRW
jgi:hypothetical protein